MSAHERHDDLHEKLCAWILGEAEPEVAREVEAALEASPELRAERARLEATIGAVRDVFPAQEALSEEAMERLLAAAHPEPRGLRAVPARPAPVPRVALRVAASVTLLLGGTLGALHLASRGRDAGTDLVAQGAADAATSLEAERDGNSIAFDTGAPGSGPPGSAAPGNSTLDAGTRDAGAAERRLEKGLLRELGYSGAPDTETFADPPAEVRPSAQKFGKRIGQVATRAKDDRADESLARGETYRGSEEFLGSAADGAEPVVLERGVLRDETSAQTAVSAPPGGAGGGGGPSSPGPSAPRQYGSPGSAPGSAAYPPRTRNEESAQIAPTNTPPATPPPAREMRERVVEARRVPATDQFFLGQGADSAPEETARVELRGLGEPPAPEEVGGFDGFGELGYTDGSIDTRQDEGLDARALLEREDSFADDDALLAIPRSLDALRLRGQLTEDELRRLSRLLGRRYLVDCRRRPQETPRDMYFRFWGDNPVEDTISDPLSTFSVDVDTASYVLARRYLREGHLPTREQVRTEEFVNYFTPDLPPPTEDTFALSTELARSLFGGGRERWMLRVGIRGKEVAREERPPLALTFVVDVSGSMKEGGRLETVKHAIRLLVAQLDARDSIGIVAFSQEARLILPMTSAAQRALIESALEPLAPNGGTNAEAGLKMGYELARTALDPSTHSRVVLLSDGVANIGQTDQARIGADVAAHRARGIYLNTIGVGMNNHNDVFLEQLADSGDGICDYVDDAASAHRAIVDRFSGAMIPIASDVKVQVQFDPARVVRYRLLGYENRAIADRDFRNDAVDAGEVGAGHQVVALYELELAPEPGGSPLATVRLRWKEPKAAGQHPAEIAVTEVEAPVRWSTAVASFDAAGAGYRRSVLAAQLAELLRRSSHAREDSFVVLFEKAKELALGPQGDAESQELAELVGRTIELGLPQELSRDAIEELLEEVRRQRILEARLELLQRERDAQELRDELRRRNDDLERRLQDLLLDELRRRNG